MKRWSLGLLVLLLSCAALAAGPRAVRKQAEMSMLVTGSVEVARDGSVAGLDLDQREKLPEGVVRLVEGAAPHWRFAPARRNGEPVPATARMSLNLVARRLDDGNYELGIRHAHFADRNTAAETIASRDMKPPAYPLDALHAGIKGTVYLLLRIGTQGTVEDVMAEQVNLRVVGNSHQMDRARRLLVRASLVAARAWTFKVPTTGEYADAGSWVVRVPVDYEFEDRRPGYGEWQAYIPGPRQQPDWAPEDDGAPDALLAGQVHQAGVGMRLLTPLQQEQG
ncbi:energy transducer TonB [Luteimonas suaedae]|uniref:energy transducer TonB n=1 Tax=Luteimonas suaedae TaxID=2605430 RepID=UPI002107E686|nr:energy transducer TonB [Luteimonas suaedae]